MSHVAAAITLISKSILILIAVQSDHADLAVVTTQRSNRFVRKFVQSLSKRIFKIEVGSCHYIEHFKISNFDLQAPVIGCRTRPQEDMMRPNSAMAASTSFLGAT
jgi:hypothetical protein